MINLNLALSRINLGAEVENDIRNGVNAVKIATAHETRINFNGWVGEGYILIDPNTGAGAYMISGGGSGGTIPRFILPLIFLLTWITINAILSDNPREYIKNVFGGVLNGLTLVAIIESLPATLSVAFLALASSLVNLLITAL